jgi:hypothetical protein
MEVKQHRQFTYNATLRRVRATTVAVDKQYVLHILSVFVTLVIQHAILMRHIVICGLSGIYIIFLLYLINAMIFEK